MDYDQTAMPSAYDAGRGYSPDLLAFWLQTIAEPLAGETISTILDLGCGTGRYSGELASYFDAQVIAVDPSEKMLAEARKKGNRDVQLVQGSGEAIPLADASVDLIFMSMVFHHFADPLKVAQECRRVLRRSGAICLRAGATDRIDEYPYVPFFPDSRAILSKNLQSVDYIHKAFEDAGFRSDRHEIIPSPVAGSWSEFADKIAYRADSILAQLTDDKFEVGLAALRRYARESPPNERVIEQVELFLFR